MNNFKKMQEAQKAAREARKALGLKTTYTPMERLKNNPTSWRYAINAMCWECMGGADTTNVKSVIEHCSSNNCPLHGFRPRVRNKATPEGDVGAGSPGSIK